MIFIIFFSLILSSFSIERRHHCSSITCGRDCDGECGWSSFWNRCLRGYTTTRSELNSGPGCTTTSTTTETTTLSTTRTTTLTTTRTTTFLTSQTTTDTFYTLTTQNYSENQINMENDEKNSYTYILGIIVPLLFVILFFYYRKRNQRKNNTILNRGQFENMLYNEKSKPTLPEEDLISEDKMYERDTLYEGDMLYEEPVNSIEPYSVSDSLEKQGELDREYEIVE